MGKGGGGGGGGWGETHPGQSPWLHSKACTGGSNKHISDDRANKKSRLDSPYLETREAGPFIVRMNTNQVRKHLCVSGGNLRRHSPAGHTKHSSFDTDLLNLVFSETSCSLKPPCHNRGSRERREGRKVSAR